MSKTEARIAPDLQASVVPIDRVLPHPENPNRGDVAAMVNQLRYHGQLRPLVVQRSTGYILVGNHCWEAARREGWDRIAVVYVDDSDDEARARLVGDNLPARSARDDDQQLLRVLAEIAVERSDVTGAGHDGNTLADLLARTEAPSLEDALARDPSEPREEEFWPTLRIEVTADTLARWDALVEREGGDAAGVFARMMADLLTGEA